MKQLKFDSFYEWLQHAKGKGSRKCLRKLKRWVESKSTFHRRPRASVIGDSSITFQWIRIYLLDGEPTTFGLPHRRWSNTLGITRYITNLRIKEEKIIVGIER